MRDGLLKIYVDEEAYKCVQVYGCSTVEFISLSDNHPIKKMDFIVFVDNKGNEVLRNMWEIDDNQIHYTSGMMGNLSENLTLSAVLTNLYNSIMHLRHGAYTEKRFFLKDFPMDMVRHEVQMIRLCLELLDESIHVEQFADGLNALTEGDDTYYFESSVAILKLYPWNYELNERRREHIEKSVRRWRRLRNVWRTRGSGIVFGGLHIRSTMNQLLSFEGMCLRSCL